MEREFQAYQGKGSARFQRPKKQAPDGVLWICAISLTWLNFCHLLASVRAKGKIFPLPPSYSYLYLPPQSLQNIFYFIVSLLIGDKLWNSSPHQTQPTSCCLGTYISAWSRCYCLKIPNKTPLATIISIASEALYNFQSKWH